MSDPQNDRITSPASFRQLDPPREDEAKFGCWLTVNEDSLVGAQSPERGCVHERAPLITGQGREDRKAAKEIWVDAHERLNRCAGAGLPEEGAAR
jgi:hypothetical protein